MAIAWWMDTGIHFKMASDIRAEYGSHLMVDLTWRKPKIRDNLTLGISHVLPSLIIFGVATFISIIAFALEIVHNLSKQNKMKKNRRRRQRQRRQKRDMAQPKRARAQPEIPRKAWA